MKTKLLFLSIALTSLFSCSDDDSANANVTPVAEKKILQVKKSLQSQDSDFRGVYDYVNDKVVKIAYYYGDIPAKTDVYVYDANGRVSQLTSSDEEITNTTVTNYKYDELGRIDNIIVKEYSQEITYSYQYNGNIIVCSQSPYYEFTTYKYPITYNVDANGQINKILDKEGVFQEATYNSQGLTSLIISNANIKYSNYNYVYDKQHISKGKLNEVDTNMYGDYFNNNALINTTLSVKVEEPGYLIQSSFTDDNSNTSYTTKYKYEYDADGYPVKVSFYQGDSTTPYQINEVTYE